MDYVEAFVKGKICLAQAIAECNYMLEQAGRELDKASISNEKTNQKLLSLYNQEDKLEALIPTGMRKTEYMKNYGYHMAEVDGLRLWVSSR